MAKLLEFIDGKKTYITAVLIGIFAALQALGIVVPEWVYAILAAAGLGSLRAAKK
jgi:hypothetical protein